MDVDILIKKVDSPLGEGQGGMNTTYQAGDIVIYRVVPHSGWGPMEDPRARDPRYGGDPANYPFWLITLTGVPDEQTIIDLIEPVYDSTNPEFPVMTKKRRWKIDTLAIPANVRNQLNRDGYRSAPWSLVAGWLADRGVL